MTIRQPKASAPTEDEVRESTPSDAIVVNAEPVTDPFGSESNMNVPFAQADSIPSEREQGTGASCAPTAYSTGASRVAVSTGAPVIRAPQTHGTPVQRRWGNRNRNECECCGYQTTCCCITTTIVTLICVIVVIPAVVVVVFVLKAIYAVAQNNGEIMLDDDYWHIDDIGMNHSFFHDDAWIDKMPYDP